MNIKKYVKERDKAFRSYLYEHDLKPMRKLSVKYALPKTSSDYIFQLGILKAIQQCETFTEEEKTKAKMQELFIRWEHKMEMKHG